MKNLLKQILKGCWRATAWMRRPIARKFEAYLTRCLRPTEALLASETNVLMDHVVRELVWLERQVEELRSVVKDLTIAVEDFTHPAETDETAPVDQAGRLVAGRLRAG